MQNLAMAFALGIICASATTAYAYAEDTYYNYGQTPAYGQSSPHGSPIYEGRAAATTPEPLYNNEATYGMFNRTRNDLAN